MVNSRYSEAIPLLYSENVFKVRRYFDMICFPKYLLKQRLETIRCFHCTLQLGYPWHVQHLPLQALAELRGLRRLTIDGIGNGTIDSKNQVVIDLALWKARKHYIIPFIRELNYIPEVDVYLPIMESYLRKDFNVGHCRIHGIGPLSKTKDTTSDTSSFV